MDFQTNSIANALKWATFSNKVVKHYKYVNQQSSVDQVVEADDDLDFRQKLNNTNHGINFCMASIYVDYDVDSQTLTITEV